MVDNSFDLSLFKAKNHIDDAVGMAKRGQQPMLDQRMPNLGPVPNQQPTNIPGNPQLTPFGVAVSGQKQVGPGMVSGGAMVGPQGFEGGGANYSVPVAGGQFDVGASMDPRMKMAQMQAQYQRGPFSVGAQYQPGAGVSGGVTYNKAFAKGGLAMAEGGGAWTRKEGKNPSGGLNAKGRASLKAQGQDIKPPVSAKQAKNSPKLAARRKSFCARMSGMPGPMKDEGGKPTRKALALRKWDCKAKGGMVEGYAEGGKSRVNEAGNYTKPGMRKSLFNSIKSGGSGGAPGQWSARKAQMLAKQYKARGGGYK
jgi:hypothetical protein